MSLLWTRRKLMGASVALPAALKMGAAAAEGDPIRILIGFAAGGGADEVGRLMAGAMQQVSGRPMVVENRAGAGGRIAIMAVKSSGPDGNMVFFGSTSVLTLFPYVFSDLPYSLERDYTPIATCCSFPYAIVVSPRIGVDDLKGLAEWAKANPKQAFFGTPGVGTPQHLIGSLLGRSMDAPLEHLAFKSGSEATQQLLVGSIPIVVATAGQFYPLHKSGQVKIIAVTGRQRSRSLSEVPTCAESGLANLVFEDSFGLVGPANMRPDTRSFLEQAVEHAMNKSQVQRGLAAQDMEPLRIQGAAYARYLADEKVRWEQTVRAVGFKPAAA